MRIVLDTNVIIAAFAARGLCAEIFELCVLEHDVYLSKFILDECAEKFREKVKLPPKKVKDVLLYLKEISEIVEPTVMAPDIFEDPDDLPVIGTAVSSKADLLVTGDKALLALKKIQKTKIVSPRGLWTVLAS
ncbi:MAG: putative toxin-antitoxin system toxin component, PIN family [bacterium]|nr:putative toxin-antitoxin system toxin component, PIN family [bacterium]